MGRKGIKKELADDFKKMEVNSNNLPKNPVSDSPEEYESIWNDIPKSEPPYRPESEPEPLSEVEEDEIAAQEAEDTESPNYIVDCWSTFITNFKRTKEDPRTKEKISTYPYTDQVYNMIAHKPLYENKSLGTGVFYVSYEDLSLAIEVLADSEENKKKYKLLENLIKNHYDTAVEACREAVYKNLLVSQPEYASYLMYGAIEYTKRNRITISVYDYTEHSEIDDFTGEHVEKFVKTDGLVEQFDDRSTIQILEAVWECSLGHSSITDGKTVLKECRHCDSKNVKLNMAKSYKTSYMYVRIQQRADKTESDIPKEVDIKIVGDEYVKRISKLLYPGAYLGINGIIRTVDKRAGQDSVAIYIEASSVELQSDESLYDEDPELLDLVSQPIAPEDIDEHYQKLCHSMTPTLNGLEPVKEAMLLMAVGGVTKSLNNGTARRRGDICILLFGTTALGKTELIKFVVKLAPKSQYVMASSVTPAGITAGVSTADSMKSNARITSRRILFGAYPLCSGGGICGVDELDKVKDKSLWHDIGQVMDEWQMLPLHKFGINRDLPCYCASIHAANPVSNAGQYDPTLSISEQCEFPDQLLSRYDLIFPFYTRESARESERFLEHQRKTYAYVTLEDNNRVGIGKKSQINEDTSVRKQKVKISSSGGTFSISYIRAEVKYLRDNFKPEFHPQTQAWKDIEDFFKKHSAANLLPFRQDLEKKINSPNPNLIIPALDNRAFGTLLRLAEASAKLHRRNIVTRDDAATAMRLVEITIGALIPERDTSRQEMLAGLKFSKEYMRQQQMTEKKEQREAITHRRKNLRKFQNFMKALLFERCGRCHGSGKVMEVADELTGKKEPRDCDTCQGSKGQYLKLRIETFDNQVGKLQYDGMLKTEINELFNAYVKSGVLVLGSDGSYRVAVRFDTPAFEDIVSRFLVGPDPDADSYEEQQQQQEQEQPDLEEQQQQEPYIEESVNVNVNVPSPPRYDFKPRNQADYDADEFAKRELDSLGGDVV